jgi:hypothetical protein
MGLQKQGTGLLSLCHWPCPTLHVTVTIYQILLMTGVSVCSSQLKYFIFTSLSSLNALSELKSNSSSFSSSSLTPYSREAHISQKSISHLKILGINVQNLVICAIWCPGFVNPTSYRHPSTRYNVHIIPKTGSMNQIQNWDIQITWLFFFVHGKESSFTDQAVSCRRISSNSTTE